MFTVHIKRMADGVERPHENEGSWFSDAQEFQWCDNNYSCDCNRFLFFERAGGAEPKWGDGECGDEAYRIRVTDEFGKEVFREDGFDNPSSSSEPKANGSPDSLPSNME